MLRKFIISKNIHHMYLHLQYILLYYIGILKNIKILIMEKI